MLDIYPIDGRIFNDIDPQSSEAKYIFNDMAMKLYNLEVGEKNYRDGKIDGEIIGAINDIKFRSFRTETEPMAFYLPGKNSNPYFQYCFIKLENKFNWTMCKKSIEIALNDIDSEYDLDIFFYNTILDNLYKKESNISFLINLFTVVVLIISIIGVIGIVYFDNQYKMKEIGIRKVFGSSDKKIIYKLSFPYFIMTLICFVLSIPISFYISNEWLKIFSYKIVLYWWIFIFSYSVIAFITILIVIIQGNMAINRSAINNISSE